jgi:hypothetical protein
MYVIVNMLVSIVIVMAGGILDCSVGSGNFMNHIFCNQAIQNPVNSYSIAQILI